jgi:hypothetical protein
LPQNPATLGDIAGTIGYFATVLVVVFLVCLLDGGDAMAQATDCAATLTRDDEIIRAFAVIGMLALGGHALVAIIEWSR